MHAGLALVVVAGVLGLVTRSDAEPPARLHLEGGGAWVASSTVGQLTLIDGGSAEVVARARVAPAGADLRSAQAGSTGYALYRDHGTVSRVDPATFDVGAAVAVIAGARGDLAAYPSGDRLYVVDHDRGRVAVADAATALARRGKIQSLAEPVAASVVDGGGRLWTLGRHTGDLTWFDGTERDSRRGAVGDPASATLAVVDGRAAVVSLTDRTVRTLDGRGGQRARACLEVDPDDPSVRVGGSAHGDAVDVVSGDDGILRVSDLGSGRCADTAVAVAPPTSELGVPQEAQGRVFVPDYTKGTVAVVDLRTRRVVHTGELVTPGNHFELFAEDGIVFYNDPGSERAGVVAVDGTFSAVAKYDPERPGAGLGGGGGTGVPAPGAPGDQAQGAVGDDGPGGAPGATDSPEQPGTPGPGPDGSAEPPPGSDDQATPGGQSPDAPAASGGPAPGAPAAQSRPAPNGSRPPNGRGTPPPAGRGNRPPGQLIAITAAADRVVEGEPLDLGVVATKRGSSVRNATWDFGDGATDTGRNVTHAWAEAGTYRVTVEATVRPGGQATTFADIVVLPPTREDLVAGFGASATRVRVGEPITFTDQSAGGPTRWSWTFPGADGAGTWASAAPPEQRWSTAGTYTVELVVERDGETARHTADVTIDPAPPAAPTISAITSSPGAPYDDQTDYTFQADVTGDIIDCTWTIDGASSVCAVSGGRVSAAHRFASGGAKAVSVAVRGLGGNASQQTVVNVAHLTAPAPSILVSGATRQPDGSFLGVDDTPVTFTSGTTGTFERLDWTNGTVGATGPVWSPPLGAGNYTVTLTAVSRIFGNRSASVSLVIERADPTPPVATIPLTTGTAAVLYIQATGSDPESGVTRIDVYGTYSGVCHVGGQDIPFDLDHSTTPFGSGTGSELVPQPDGSVDFIVQAPTGCPEIVDGVDLRLRVWAVVTNGRGQQTRSADYTAS